MTENDSGIIVTTRRNLFKRVAVAGSALIASAALSGCAPGRLAEEAMKAAAARATSKAGRDKAINDYELAKKATQEAPIIKAEKKREVEEEKRRVFEERLKEEVQKRGIDPARIIEVKLYEGEKNHERKTGWKAPPLGVNIRLLPFQSDGKAPLLDTFQWGQPIRGIAYEILINEPAKQGRSSWYAIDVAEYHRLCPPSRIPEKKGTFKVDEKQYVFVCKDILGEKILKDEISFR